MDKNTVNKLKPALLGIVVIVICAVKAFSGSGVISSDKNDSSSKAASSAIVRESSSSSEKSPEKNTAVTTTTVKTTAETEKTTTTTTTTAVVTEQDKEYVEYYFRTKNLRDSHYEKHGIEMGFSSADEYRHAASDVINNPDALSKIEKEDGDTCYYIEETDEFVVLSTDGYIRTYFNPGGKAYFDRQ